MLQQPNSICCLACLCWLSCAFQPLSGSLPCIELHAFSSLAVCLQCVGLLPCRLKCLLQHGILTLRLRAACVDAGFRLMLLFRPCCRHVDAACETCRHAPAKAAHLLAVFQAYGVTVTLRGGDAAYASIRVNMECYCGG